MRERRRNIFLWIYGRSREGSFFFLNEWNSFVVRFPIMQINFIIATYFFPSEMNEKKWSDCDRKVSIKARSFCLTNRIPLMDVAEKQASGALFFSLNWFVRLIGQPSPTIKVDEQKKNKRGRGNVWCVIRCKSVNNLLRLTTANNSIIIPRKSARVGLWRFIIPSFWYLFNYN